MDNKLVGLERDVGELKQGQQGQVGLMVMMLKAQGIAPDKIDKELVANGLKPAQSTATGAPPHTPAKSNDTEGKSNSMHIDGDDPNANSDDLWGDDATVAMQKFLHLDDCADSTSLDDVKELCLMRCNDLTIICYILQARSKTSLVHVLSNIND